jgi:CTP synthase
VHDPEHDVEVALVGKYIDLPDAYLSVTEALRAGGFHHDARVRIRWVASDECQTPTGAQRALGGVDAILVPGGFGVRGIEGKLGALTWAREMQVPTLGICLGLQCMVIEYARSVLGDADASSTEFEPDTSCPVIATMEEQKAFVDGAGDLGGTMRLGSQTAHLVEGSVVSTAYGSTTADERHRHRYEVNESYRDALTDSGLVISGTHPELGLVEFVELPADVHPYYVSTQAHPEFKSRPTRAHPLFAGLVGAAIEAQRASRLVEVERPRHHEPAEANA